MITTTKPSRKKAYFIATPKGEWGPVDWSLLRYWLGRGWFSPQTKIREQKAPDFVFAKDVDQLWKIAGRPYVAEDLSPSMASGKLPISRALKRYLREEFGWPGETDRLNYYDADKLRKELEKAFPCTNRPLLDDPDWPSCWSEPCPAELARKQVHWQSERDARPLTDKQAATLRLFGVKTDGLTVPMASARIDELMQEPANLARYEAKQRAEPATEPQMIRLRFAAKQLKRMVPANISKFDASRLLDEWYEDSDLEDAYQEYKAELRLEAEEREMEQEMTEARRDLYRHVRSDKRKARRGNPILLLVIIFAAFAFFGWFFGLR